VKSSQVVVVASKTAKSAVFVVTDIN